MFFFFFFFYLFVSIPLTIPSCPLLPLCVPSDPWSPSRVSVLKAKGSTTFSVMTHLYSVPTLSSSNFLHVNKPNHLCVSFFFPFPFLFVLCLCVCVSRVWCLCFRGGGNNEEVRVVENLGVRDTEESKRGESRRGSYR